MNTQEFLRSRKSDGLKIAILLLVIVSSVFFISNSLQTSSINLAQIVNSVKVAPEVTVNPTSVVISWNTTQVANSIVRYGLTASYGETTPKLDMNPMVTHHIVTLDNLAPSTTYFYQIKSRDISGVVTISENQTFTTLPSTSDSSTGVDEGNDDNGDDENVGETPTDDTVIISSDCVTSDTNDAGDLRYCNEIYNFSTEVTKTSNIQYATSPDGDSSLLYLDLYLPPSNDAKGPLPVAFNLHGGGGDKADSGWCKKFASRGWACASINYRGEGGGNFTNANQRLAGTDLAAAVRWVRANALKYNFDKNRIIATGVSAGGLTSLAADLLGNNITDPVLTSDVRMSQSNWGQPSWLCYAVSHPGGVTNTMMDYFLDANDGSVWDFHGEKDLTLDYKATKDAFDRLADVIPATFTHWADVGHKVGHDDDITPMLFAKLYQDVILGGCPQSHSTIPHIN